MIPRHLLIAVAVLLVLVVAMGIYARHMRLQAGRLEASAASVLPVVPPASGPTETVTLYVADDDAGILRARSARGIVLYGFYETGYHSACVVTCS